MHIYKKLKNTLCEDVRYIISGVLPLQYRESNVLELAGFKDDLSINIIYQLEHGFKSVHPEYTISFLDHRCAKKEQFVDIIERNKFNDLEIYIPKEASCIYACFIGSDSFLTESIS